MKQLIFLFVAITLISCGATQTEKTSHPKDESMDITSTFWKLDLLEGEKVMHPEDPRHIGFILNNDEYRISGWAGCNNFFGTFKISDDKISFSQMGSTRMACLTTTFDENKFLRIFENVDRYQIKNDRLELLKGSTVLAVLQAESDSASGELEEKYWKLNTLRGKAVTIENEQEQEIHFILKKQEGKISGFAGCNAFSGNYKLNGKKLELSKVISTLRACPHLKFQDSDFTSLFGEMDTYEVKDDLLIFKKGAKELATFNAVHF